MGKQVPAGAPGGKGERPYVRMPHLTATPTKPAPKLTEAHYRTSPRLA